MKKAKWENTAVIIPVFNAREHLDELISRILKFFPKEQIFAINDASTDNSKEICKKYDLNLIDFPVNSGKGFALQKGFQAAILTNFDFAFVIDSDLQHEPEEFPNFLKLQNEFDYDLIIGKRDFSYDQMPFLRVFSNSITSGIVSFFTGQKIEDSQSGFRLYNLNIIKDFKFRTRRYQFETEIILKFSEKNAKIGFVPIKTIYNDEVSHISHLRDIIYFLDVIFYERFLMKSSRKYRKESRRKKRRKKIINSLRS
ncbi:MAG: glycosyltransferase family 2 protein [Candidatus Cloacimonetes bacterium]|nr:glycosyltransferase family 2 protein [Candidatus Cloacimonadota bacterium]